MKLPISQYPEQPRVRTGLKPSRRESATQKYDEAWMRSSESFDPRRSAHTHSRYVLEKELLGKIPASRAVDLGSGLGLHAKTLHDKNTEVHAVDVSPIALKQLSFLPENQKIHAYIPYTPLSDNHFELALALDLLGEIPPEEQRLCISEIARLITEQGKVLLSAELDVYSEGPLSKILYLIETELQIEEIHLLHHGLFIKVCDWFAFAPALHKQLLKWQGMARLLEKWAQFYQTETDASAVVLIASRKKMAGMKMPEIP